MGYGDDMVPRSRLDAVELELKTEKDNLAKVQRDATTEINGLMRRLDVLLNACVETDETLRRVLAITGNAIRGTPTNRREE